MSDHKREGSLEAPIRHPLDWKSDNFYNEKNLFEELERVFDICHGCRRCFNLCNSFPTLFDLVDESETFEVDGVKKEDYWQVVDHCYLCDMCYMSKCPYVPPHSWNVDFPHLMLRAKAVKFKKGETSSRDKLLSNTDSVGRFAGIPIIAQTVNAVNKTKSGRKLLQKTLGVHADAVVPEYHSKTLRKRLKKHTPLQVEASPTANTKGKIALFATCYGNRNLPQMGEDLVKVFEHNKIPITLVNKEVCCGMPKFELGDLESLEKSKNENIPVLAKMVDAGWDLTAPVPSCVLMFKQELPLMFPDDPDVIKVRDAFYDPFEYLIQRHKENKLNTEFKTVLGDVSYQVPCHLRVQNIGLKTKEILELIPDTKVEAIERCSGHDGTYAVKEEFHEISMKIAKPVINRVTKSSAQHFTSDCPMAAEQIMNGVNKSDPNSQPHAMHPISLLCKAYGI